MKKFFYVLLMFVSLPTFAGTTICTGFCVYDTAHILLGGHETYVTSVIGKGITREEAIKNMRLRCPLTKSKDKWSVQSGLYFLNQNRVSFGEISIEAYEKNYSCIEL